MILVEPGSFFKHFASLIQNKSMTRCVDCESPEWNSKILLADSKESTEFNHNVFDAAIPDIKHDVLDVSQLFILQVVDVVADDRCCCQEPYGFIRILPFMVLSGQILRF